MPEIEPASAITSVPIPTNLSVVPAASSPIKFPAPATDADFNWSDTSTATGTSTGTTTLTLASAAGHIKLPSTITGTGVPANTYLVSQTSGTPGGNGVYVTNNVTTLAGVALTFTGTIPIEPDGAPQPPIVVNPATVIPGEPLSKTASANTFTLVLPTFAFMPLAIATITNISSVPPWAGKTGNPVCNPPPVLTMTRTPPFPAYPS